MDTSRINWRTSSYSTGNGGQCVEVGAWYRSLRSTQQGISVKVSGIWETSGYAEVAASEALVLARDSRDPDGPVLSFDGEAWTAFLTLAKTGYLDLH